VQLLQYPHECRCQLESTDWQAASWPQLDQASEQHQHLPSTHVPVHEPQLPPQPSGPQVFPAQLGTHTHCPEVLHVGVEPLQVPQLPPQPSGPHCLPVQAGLQTHWPVVVLQVGFAPLHVPQLPPQVSSPHCLFTQAGTHVHWKVALQVLGKVQVPHSPPQPSPPHCLPAQLGEQPPQPPPLHVPVAQVVPSGSALCSHAPFAHESLVQSLPSAQVVHACPLRPQLVAVSAAGGTQVSP
jgi:hypothetical protein